MRPRQLEGIPVAGDDERVVPGLFAQKGQGAQNVVRLIARLFDQGNAHQRDQFPNHRVLSPQVLRHGSTVGLIAVVHLMPESGGVGVEGHGHALGALGFQKAQKHHGKAAVVGVPSGAVIGAVERA